MHERQSSKINPFKTAKHPYRLLRDSGLIEMSFAK